MLKHFFVISTGFRYKKMEKSSLSIYRDVHALTSLTIVQQILFIIEKGPIFFEHKCDNPVIVH